jgi:copper chaperone CopZ
MKNLLLKSLKPTGYTVLGLFVVFIIYANWEPAPLSNQVKPVSIAMLSVKGLTDQLKAKELQGQVDKLKGVTAATANVESEMISITFDPETTTEATLSSFVKQATNLNVVPKVFELVGPPSPQCPVPMGYILAFEKVKYAFCFR